MTDQNESPTSRRALFAGAGAVGAATLLAACGGSETPSTSSTTSGTTQSTPTTGGDGTPTVLAKKSDIPVGGGKIFGEEGVVITQPTAGNFKGFSSLCTHQQCVLSSISNGNIVCGCHQSQFSVTDGSVKKGPATQALPAKTLKIDGDDISVA